MAIDNTPPRIKLIVTIAAITVITLVGISFVTQSYYAMMTDEAKHEKIAPTRDRDEQMESEKKAFTSAAMPVDKAMGEVAKGLRPEAITPQPSDDVGAVTGWAKLPHPAPTTQQPVGSSQPEAPIGDGGVMLGADGGLVGDAGAGDAGAAKGGRDAGAGHRGLKHGGENHP